MNPLGLVAISAGGVLIYSGVKGVNPLDLTKAAVSGKPLPSPGSWGATLDAAAGGSGMTATGQALEWGDTSAVRNKILAFAKAQLGETYVLGAAGPDAWDCSGLTSKAYMSAGIVLPRTSILQSVMGKTVSEAQAKPADLVFFGSPVHHVALWVSPGKILHSPHTGSVVKYEEIWHNERWFIKNVIDTRRGGAGGRKK